MRPDPLPFRACAVVKASLALTWGEKAVWLEEWGLDRGPEGAWISDVNLAARLGLTEGTVKQTRYRLTMLALRVRIPRPGARLPGAAPILPAICVPGAKPSPNEIQLCARELDAHVAVNRGSSASKPSLTE